MERPVTRSSARFEVVVTGKSHDHKATRQRISVHARADSALGRVIDILKQWSASHGAVQPGTTVMVIDLTDGGKYFQMEFLGYEPQGLFPGGSE